MRLSASFQFEIPWLLLLIMAFWLFEAEVVSSSLFMTFFFLSLAFLEPAAELLMTKVPLPYCREPRTELQNVAIINGRCGDNSAVPSKEPASGVRAP